MVEDKTIRVLIGMSGGVDSSSAAAIMRDQGYELIGVTFKLWPQDCVSRAEDKCCGPQAVMDARSVCDKLDIPYYLIDEADQFQKQIIQYFADEYKAGRTPNPCVMCNEKLKFGTMISRADQLGADFIATGHYARIEHRDDGRVLLRRGCDLNKDQSYFLFSLRQEQLRRTIFPLGELNKSQTRDVARDEGLKTAEKEESQEICFVPDNDYGGFLKKADLVKSHTGNIVDTAGRVIGQHEGIEFYTIGQRKGLGIAVGKPLYVVDLDPEQNVVIVGETEDLFRDTFYIERCNWIPYEEPPAEFEAMAKIRYNHKGIGAKIYPQKDGRAKVILAAPQRAVTPGQACVFYQDDLVVGGGWIVKETPRSVPENETVAAHA